MLVKPTVWVVWTDKSGGEAPGILQAFRHRHEARAYAYQTALAAVDRAGAGSSNIRFRTGDTFEQYEVGNGYLFVNMNQVGMNE